MDTDKRQPLPASSPPSAAFFNRDISWVDFNERVLEEGLRKEAPPLERFRFLSIVSSNCDEFFMVRVAAIKQMLRSGEKAAEGADFSAGPSGLGPAEQLEEISRRTRSIIKRQYDCLRNEVLPDLAKGGLELLRPGSYSPAGTNYLESFFLANIYPILTPLRIEQDKPLPSINSFRLNAAFLLEPETLPAEKGGVPETAAEDPVVMVQLPSDPGRIIWLPVEQQAERAAEQPRQWALLDDLILARGARLFPGYRVKESMIFKVSRDADFSVDEKRDEDFIVAMEEVLEGRERSDAVRMEYTSGSGRLRDELAKRFSLKAEDLYEIDGPLCLGELIDLYSVPGFDGLREKAWKIYPSSAFNEDVSIWDRISEGDVMLHFPYQSFDPVVRFFQDASADPSVVSIKTALYRTSGGSSPAVSPIIRALEQAALNGKQVTALVELKARFDEERNINWANRLEKAGVIVIYGLSRLKVHAKITMVMRREQGRIKRYVHLSTGNYNDRTAKFYEDLCLFTCREEIAYDAGLLFNMVTGYSVVQSMRRLAIAPSGLKRRLLELIERETKRTGQEYPGKIMAKLNALTDIDVINALYRASKAGVKISLCVRGICTLIPALEGLSEIIRVVSVIDRYLEHSRIYYFANGGAEELYLSSADWMPRNLERRVELMFPVEDERIRSELLGILCAYFEDNCQARVLDSGGAWTMLRPRAGEKPFRVQRDMLLRAARSAGNSRMIKQEFIVRRSSPAP
ncbi:MAG: polyphosphate kinase 1 [Treponema sp.]|jgi:polyphosphate kinase|nr:polyphosphate kinase 1 [Treponema sp.]